MSLKKLIEHNTGNSGEHWAIAAIDINISRDSMRVRYELFKNKDAYESGKKSMGMTKTLTIAPLFKSVAEMLSLIDTQSKVQITDDQRSVDQPFFKGASDA